MKVHQQEQEQEWEFDMGDEIEMALGEASTQDMVDLAGIMGLHSMINQVTRLLLVLALLFLLLLLLLLLLLPPQDQYHHSVGARSSHVEKPLDTDLGWDGITKATPLKYGSGLRSFLLRTFAVLHRFLDDCDLFY